MSVTFDPFTGPGSTPARRRFWDDAVSLVNASRKLPGQNVKVDEYPSGSVISVPDSRTRGSACPLLSVTFSDVTFECACTHQGGFNSLELYDVSFNGTTFDLGVAFTDTPPINCLYNPDPGSQVGDVLFVGVRDCSIEAVRAAQPSALYAGSVAGVFYIIFLAGGAGIEDAQNKAVFVGSAAMSGFPLTVNNDLVCGDFGTFTDPVFTTLFGSQTYWAGAGGGTASVTLT